MSSEATWLGSQLGASLSLRPGALLLLLPAAGPEPGRPSWGLGAGLGWGRGIRSPGRPCLWEA